jgi:hypothetical protein
MATIDEVHTIVKDTAKDVTELVKWKAGMTEACKAHRKETDNLNEAVYGNPGGLRGKVEKLWEWREIILYVVKIVAATGAVGLLIWLFNSIFGGS